jgi:hypothetical protein
MADYADEGEICPEPEWIPGKVNYSITHNKDQKLALDITFSVKPQNIAFTLSGKMLKNGEPEELSFTQAGIISTGLDQTIPIISTQNLPNKVLAMERTIEWTIQIGEEIFPLGISGPHFIYVLWAEPREKNSYGADNFLTEKRISWLTSTHIAGGKDSIDAIAKSIQDAVDKAVDTSGVSEFTSGSDFWALLDGTKSGQCAQMALLMEMANRLLGIQAEYKFIMASDELPIRVSTAAKPMGPKMRKCPVHGEEKLYLFFTSTGWNRGEGTCDVNGKLYAAWVGGMVGTAEGNRTAEHHILLQLAELQRNPRDPDLPRNPDLQRWFRVDTETACDQPGWNPPVPEAPK